MLSAIDGAEPSTRHTEPPPPPPEPSKFDKAVREAQQARSAADGKPPADHADQAPVVVKPGDTLTSIAGQHDESLSRIEANNAQLCNPNLIHPGQIVFAKAPPAPPPKVAPKTNTPPTPPPTPEGAKVLDNYSSELNELHQWDSLTSGMPPAQRQAEEEALNRPIAAAQYLQSIAWGTQSDSININHPPSNLTADQQAVINYVRNTPSLRNALDVAENGGKADGTISADDCGAFVNNAQNQVSAASSAYNSYLKAHPNADPQSRELTRSAAILAANQSLLATAAPSYDPGAAGQKSATGLVDGSDLSSVAQANAHQSALSSQLVGAAALWSHPGMLEKLDQAGDDLATMQPDGAYSANNISSWISKESPSTPDQFRELITGAAARDLTQNVSTKGLGYDVFADPGKYTGQQKAAVMFQLSDLETKLRAGKNDWDPFVANQAGIWGNTFMNDPTGNLAGQVQQKITQLSQDPDVVNYLSQNLPGALNNVMQSDPSVAAAAQSYYHNNVQNGAALRTALHGAKPGDVPNDLVNFEQQAGFYDQSLGTKTNIRSIVDANPDLKTTLQNSYMQQIANGGALQSALNGKQSLQDAIGQFNTQNLAYAQVLDPQFLNQHAGEARSAFANIVQNNLLSSATPQDLKQAFGGPNGQFDPQKVEQIIQQNQPTINAVAGTSVSTSQLVSLAQKMYNQAYKGASLQKLLNDSHEQYAAPLKALFAAAVLASTEATGKATTEQTVSSSLVLAGALIEAGGKTLPASSDAIASQLKVLGSAGKTIGGVGSGISGYFSLASGIQDLDQGDTALGVANITQGAAGLVSGGASVVEGVATGLGALDLLGSAGSIAAVAGPVGWIATGIGLVAASAIPTIEDIQQQGRDNAFLYQIAPVLDQYGFSLPAGS